MNFLVKILVYVLAVYAVDWLLVGVAFKTIAAGLAVAGCMAIINGFIKPLVQVLAFPLTLMTLGFFPLVVNTILVLLLPLGVHDFVIFGDFLFHFFWAFAFSFLLTVVTVIIEQLTGWNLPN